VFLRTAAEIGRRLSQEAFWLDDKCNWLGFEPKLASGRDEDGVGSVYRTLGPALYSGTSGVALFLAELYAVCGDGEIGRTALGAIRQAIARADALSAKSRLGFYIGGIGIVFGAVRIGTLLGDRELLKDAAQLLGEYVREREEKREFDLLSGDAGTIVALLAIRQMVADASLLELAVCLGDELLQSAERSNNGHSWRSPGIHYPHNLTGLSHGTAGVGYALLELFQATSDANYRAGAKRAFGYERSWFIADKGNWPDFREFGKQRRRPFVPLACSTFWCHGAPGIALSRLRAYEILGDTAWKDEAKVALHTTRTMIEASLRTASENFCLCHGLAGNAEVLLHGIRILGETGRDKSLALGTARAGIEASRREGGAWSFGVRKEENPSLLLGLAGIGYFYLRLHSPAIPSILMVRPDDFSTKLGPVTGGSP
jgi:lantibiotic modifying enzyme